MRSHRGNGRADGRWLGLVAVAVEARHRGRARGGRTRGPDQLAHGGRYVRRVRADGVGVVAGEDEGADPLGQGEFGQLLGLVPGRPAQRPSGPARRPSGPARRPGGPARWPRRGHRELPADVQQPPHRAGSPARLGHGLIDDGVALGQLTWPKIAQRGKPAIGPTAGQA